MGQVHIDLGSGDGKYPYRLARRFPERLFVAVDTNPEALIPTARKAGRKASRGGVANLLCIAEAAEVLGSELPGVADRVSVLLPWGRLLHSVVEPKLEDLASIAALCQQGAKVEVLFSYDAQVDGQGHDGLGTSQLDEHHITDRLPELYGAVGLVVKEVKRVSMAELKGYETTWAKRLGYGRVREVWRIRAVKEG